MILRDAIEQAGGVGCSVQSVAANGATGPKWTVKYIGKGHVFLESFDGIEHVNNINSHGWTPYIEPKAPEKVVVRSYVSGSHGYVHHVIKGSIGDRDLIDGKAKLIEEREIVVME